MKKYFIIFCVFLIKDALSLPCGNCNRCPTVATGNAISTVGGCRGHHTANVPLTTEIVPALQFGDVNIAGDIPIGGSIKVCGCFPVYGVVSVDGTVPSTGSAVITAGGSLAATSEPCGCGCGYRGF